MINNRVDDDDILQASETEEAAQLVYKFPNARASSVRTIMVARRSGSSNTGVTSPSCRHSADSCDSNCWHRNDSADTEHRRYQSTDQLLIFTKGSETFTPHQVGIKRMPQSVDKLMDEQRVHEADRETQDFGPHDDGAKDDEVDVTVDLHGHIIGMNLSPDHRSTQFCVCLGLSVCARLVSRRKHMKRHL